MKVINDKFDGEGPEWAEYKALTECRTVSGIDSITDVFREDDKFHYLMDYHRGVSLRETLQNGPTKESHVRKYVYNLLLIIKDLNSNDI